jgi:hypothetical protein
VDRRSTRSEEIVPWAREIRRACEERRRLELADAIELEHRAAQARRDAERWPRSSSIRAGFASRARTLSVGAEERRIRAAREAALADRMAKLVIDSLLNDVCGASFRAAPTIRSAHRPTPDPERETRY